MNKPAINKIYFSSYKKFGGSEMMEIKPVTILVGKNSSGKSSISKLFPMLENSLSDDIGSPFLFDNRGVKLGVSFSDVSHNGYTSGLSFGVEYSDGFAMHVDLLSPKGNEDVIINKCHVSSNGQKRTLEYQKEKDEYVDLDSGKKYSGKSFFGFINGAFLRDIGVDNVTDYAINVDYIGPFRCFPERTYYSKGYDWSNKVGIRGENAYDWLCMSQPLQESVSKWYAENFDNVKLEIVSPEKGAYHINMVKNDHSVNIVDEGQGMSQVLPIIVRCNWGLAGSIVVMEQPELHLHPAAHASLSQLFARSSKQAKQNYIIETHSENILLGITEMVVNQNEDFTKDDVIIYFVDEDDKGTYLKEITIDDDGVMSDWPEGVFNESYELMKKIREHRSKK